MHRKLNLPLVKKVCRKNRKWFLTQKNIGIRQKKYRKSILFFCYNLYFRLVCLSKDSATLLVVIEKQQVGDSLKQVEVVFCGNSLYLSMLAASLQQNEQFRICMTDCEPVEAMPELKMLCPDVLVVEAINTTLIEIEPALKEVFHRMLIIVHRQTDSIEVLYGDRHFTASVNMLTQVICEAVS